MILIVGAGAVGTVLASFLSAAAKLPVQIYVRDKDRPAMTAVLVSTLNGVEPCGCSSGACPAPASYRCL